MTMAKESAKSRDAGGRGEGASMAVAACRQVAYTTTPIIASTRVLVGNSPSATVVSAMMSAMVAENAAMDDFGKLGGAWFRPPSPVIRRQ